VTRLGHLVRRFFGSIRPRSLDASDLAFVQGALRPNELACWQELGPADRAESVATARAAVAALGSHVDPRWVAAALLHDVGKAQTGFGVIRRSGATALAWGFPRARGWSGAIGRYLNHDEVGANRLRQAGARPEAVVWAAAHHRKGLWPSTGMPLGICEILAVADGEPSGQ
jgi:putative nucleotidyltransferase with HDIG domain